MTEIAVRSSGFILMRELEESGALTPTSLDLSSLPDLSYDTYESLGAMFGSINSGSRFWLGDLLNIGEARFGESYAQVEKATGLSEQTLRNVQSVCRRVPASRRRAALRFTHHAEVASQEPRDQTRWLKEAEAEHLSSHELRTRIQAERAGHPDILEQRFEETTLSVDAAARAVWHASTRIVGDAFLTPAEVMLEMRKALGE